MGIFKLEGELLVIDKDYVRGLEEYKTILERDKGSEGDAQGRKKARAFKEFFYIYMIADRTSYLNKGGYNPKEAHKLAVREAKLEEDYKADSAVKNAIEKYIEIQDIEAPTLATVHTILKGIRTSNYICSSMVDNINKTIELSEKKRAEKELNNESIDYASDLAVTASLVAQLQEFMKIAGSIPKTSDILESLKDKLEKELKGTVDTRGGHKLGKRADPK